MMVHNFIELYLLYFTLLLAYAFELEISRTGVRQIMIIAFFVHSNLIQVIYMWKA